MPKKKKIDVFVTHVCTVFLRSQRRQSDMIPPTYGNLSNSHLFEMCNSFNLSHVSKDNWRADCYAKQTVSYCLND